MEQQIKTRIVFKHETEEDWSLATGFKPLEGEMVVCDANDDHGPYLKVGDNSSTVSQLPLVEAVPTGFYGVCDTASSTAAKVVTIPNFKLKVGAMIIVKFVYANGATNPTLNVNGTGALPMYRYGTTKMSTGTNTNGWTDNSVLLLVYDGTGWIKEYWSNSTYSNASLGQGRGTCSTAESTTAKVVTLSSYSLATGGIVAIKFTYNVPANATLNINGRGAKDIYFRGTIITANVIKAGDVATFIYTGSYYELLAVDRWQSDINTHINNSTIHITSAERQKWNTDEIYVGDGEMPAGATIQLIMDGENEEPGNTGSLTEADKTEIKNAVIASLTTEQWVFTLEDGLTVTKEVVLK